MLAWAVSDHSHPCHCGGCEVWSFVEEKTWLTTDHVTRNNSCWTTYCKWQQSIMVTQVKTAVTGRHSTLLCYMRCCRMLVCIYCASISETVLDGETNVCATLSLFYFL